MTDGQEPSKRQRQKERRAAKRVQQQRAAVAAKRRRTTATAAVVLLVLAGVGALVAGQVSNWRERQATVADAEERLADFGCTPLEEMADLGAGHFSGQPAELEASPPSEAYAHRPTTSGRHLPSVVATGVYDDYVDERLTTHNMEHGYVIVWWDPELPADDVEEIQTWASEQIENGYEELVAAPYNEPLPDGGSVAMTAWGHRQLCDQFDPQIAEAFLIERHDSADAPESLAGPHRGGSPGEFDPATDVVVFPPLADGVPGEEFEDDPGHDTQG